MRWLTLCQESEIRFGGRLDQSAAPPPLFPVGANQIRLARRRADQILPRSGVRAESLRAGSENMPNFVTFWPIPVV